MACPATSGQVARCMPNCAAYNHTTATHMCGGLVRTPSYADVVRRPASPLARSDSSRTNDSPAGTAGQPLLGKPRVELPLSQLTLGKTSPPWNAGAWRINTCEVRGDVLHVSYPQGSSNLSSRGPPGGCNFKARPRCLPARDVTLSYKVRFAPEFEWSKGGKLPGLFIGYGEASGGEHSATAASCRLMWRQEGGVVAYVYTPTGVRQSAEYTRAVQPGAGRYGDKIFGDLDLKVRRGEDWNTIVLRVRLNGFDKNGSPQPDGMLTLGVNNQTATLGGIVWRRRRDVQIASIAVTTFYGGKWRCPSDTYAEFTGFTCVA